MNPDLDAYASSLCAIYIPFLADMPAILSKPLPRLHNHVADQPPLVHERSAQGLGASPGLGTAAVEVHAVDEGRGQRCCAGELQGAVGAELDDGRAPGALGCDGEVYGRFCSANGDDDERMRAHV